MSTRETEKAVPGDEECEAFARNVDEFGVERVVICTLAKFHNENDSMHYDGRFHINWEYD